MDKVPVIVSEDFAGIYGYNDTFFHSGFLNEKFFVFSSDYKGQERIYLLDTTSGDLSVLQIKAQPKSVGNYTLMRRHRNMLIVKYMEATQPTHIYAVRISNLNVANTKELLAESNLKIDLLEANKFDDS